MARPLRCLATDLDERVGNPDPAGPPDVTCHGGWQRSIGLRDDPRRPRTRGSGGRGTRHPADRIDAWHEETDSSPFSSLATRWVAFRLARIDSFSRAAAQEGRGRRWDCLPRSPASSPESATRSRTLTRHPSVLGGAGRAGGSSISLGSCARYGATPLTAVSVGYSSVVSSTNVEPASACRLRARFLVRSSMTRGRVLPLRLAASGAPLTGVADTIVTTTLRPCAPPGP